jgi:succinate dehydrogenase / fumarate reductase cytochrome b subunit
MVIQKFFMALSGSFLILFLIAHLAGNLEIFSGPDAMNTYAAFLRTVPKALWILRILTIVAFVTHIGLSINLSLKNKAARPTPYALNRPQKASMASRTMLWSGLLFLSFLLFHLAHLTWGWVNPEYAELLDSKGRHDVYTMVVMGFREPTLSAFYIAAQFFLFMHISHGFSSAAQTLSFTRTEYAEWIRRLGIVFAATVCLLYASIPLGVLFGYVTIP